MIEELKIGVFFKDTSKCGLDEKLVRPCLQFMFPYHTRRPIKIARSLENGTTSGVLTNWDS